MRIQQASAKLRNVFVPLVVVKKDMNTNKGKGTLTNGQVHAKHISSLRENFNRHVGVSLNTGGQSSFNVSMWIRWRLSIKTTCPNWQPPGFVYNLMVGFRLPHILP